MYEMIPPGIFAGLLNSRLFFTEPNQMFVTIEISLPYVLVFFCFSCCAPWVWQDVELRSCLCSCKCMHMVCQDNASSYILFQGTTGV